MLVGAGISTDSGIPDFRGPQGVWTKDPSAEKLATIGAYMADPEVRERRRGRAGSVHRCGRRNRTPATSLWSSSSAEAPSSFWSPRTSTGCISRRALTRAGRRDPREHARDGLHALREPARRHARSSTGSQRAKPDPDCLAMPRRSCLRRDPEDRDDQLRPGPRGGGPDEGGTGGRRLRPDARRGLDSVGLSGSGARTDGECATAPDW